MSDRLAGATRWSLQRIRKSGGASTANHLREAWLTSFAADNAIGAGAPTTIGPTIMSRCVLRKLPTDFVADTFDLLGGMLADRYVASERRDSEAKDAN